MLESKQGEVLSLKEWRLKKHWSFRRLAKEAGISTETLLRLEKGGQVWEVTARKIADALGVQENQVEELSRLTKSGVGTSPRSESRKPVSEGMETAILSEAVLAREWLTPEEDEYWAHL